MAEGLLRRIGEGLGWVAPQPEAAPEQLDQITGPKFVAILQERRDLRHEQKAGAFSAATDPSAPPRDRQLAQAKINRLALLEKTPALQRFDELNKSIAQLRKDRKALEASAAALPDAQAALRDLTASQQELQVEEPKLAPLRAELAHWESIDAKQASLWQQLYPTPAPATPMDSITWDRLNDEYEQLETERLATGDPTGREQRDRVAIGTQHLDRIRDDIRDARSRFTAVDHYQRRLATIDQDLARSQAELTALSTRGFTGGTVAPSGPEATAGATPLAIVTPPLPGQTDLDTLLRSERTSNQAVSWNVGGRDYHFDTDATGRRMVRFIDDKGAAQTLTVDELARREALPVMEAAGKNLDRIQHTVDEKQVQRGGRPSGGIPASVAQLLIADINSFR